MRILLDECLDWRLCQTLEAHECVSVGRRGWSGLSNGKLLEKAEEEFDVFLTGDLNLIFQQNPTDFDLAVIVLRAPSTRLSDTLPLMPEVLMALKSIRPSEVVFIAPGT